ncbi:hypothetical protein CA830_01255 [Burkholderia multivorans]|uniref:Uncharacterized protein n=1 Tax=Burkholderia multivorans (strain ATCC 17616 / 249) TaxID=395019 RepID=A0A0H3KKP9_BURM1|nr:hypothetical protein CA831_11885 [Burkholderia multivorans]OXH94487.1 hypothetical protein CA830_01255 [Burkholderia multivorans]BAG45597.1 unique hypothetical protein [Burkholderia multivorans ATCC 17616]
MSFHYVPIARTDLNWEDSAINRKQRYVVREIHNDFSELEHNRPVLLHVRLRHPPDATATYSGLYRIKACEIDR